MSLSNAIKYVIGGFDTFLKSILRNLKFKLLFNNY